MLKAIELVRTTKLMQWSVADTGAMMRGGTIRLRPIEGIGSPALAAIIPSKDPFVFRCWCKSEADPTNLMHNAILGKHLCTSSPKY